MSRQLRVSNKRGNRCIREKASGCLARVYNVYLGFRRDGPIRGGIQRVNTALNTIIAHADESNDDEKRTLGESTLRRGGGAAADVPICAHDEHDEHIRVGVRRISKFY